MKKIHKKIFIAATFCVLLILASGCNKTSPTDFSLAEASVNAISIEAPKLPISQADTSTALSVLKNHLNDYEYYYIKTTGTVTTKVLFTVNQEVSNSVIRCGNEYFSESVSVSNILSTEHQAYFKNGKVAYRTSLNGDYAVVDEDAYSNQFGVLPYGDLVLGYILNEKTILSSSKTLEGEAICFELELDSNKATEIIKIQTKQFGGLNDFPNYKSVKMKLYFNESWTPLYVDTEAVYTISLPIIGTKDCKQVLRAEFKSLNVPFEMPNGDALSDLIS